ncbi:MAG: IMP dehydrogenase [Oligoflexia bacterium]|nr:IMP dehydrogenase [Oligoflexia bacterium]
MKTIIDGLTFDDVLLMPGESSVLPGDVDVKARLSSSIHLNIPLVSAAMDTVTESRTAIAMAQVGGLGVIHKNFEIPRQAAEVARVKKFEAGMIVDPITLKPEDTVATAKKIMAEYKISGFPVVDNSGKAIGIVTNRDLRFVEDMSLRISTIMTSKDLVTVPVDTTLDKAKKILQEHRIEKLLVVEKNGHLSGLITVKDIEKSILYPYSCKDTFGRLRVGAAVGTADDTMERVDELVKAGVDFIVVDTAHGHSSKVIETVKTLRKKNPDLTLVGGNVATFDAAKALASAGVDSVKAGVGPGSICTTRIVAGIGVPQLTAIFECSRALKGSGVSLIADGGIKFSGDIVKGLAAGADIIMIGGLLAGTDESPGEMVLYQGRSYKVYRGMGSIGAMKQGSKDRYFQNDISDSLKLVPEGVEGQVPYRGSLSSVIHQLIGGLRAGMGYVGAKNIEELKEKSKFVKITAQGLSESHAHDVMITKEAPNYRIEK